MNTQETDRNFVDGLQIFSSKKEDGQHVRLGGET